MPTKFHSRLTPTQAVKRLQSFFNSRKRFDYAAKKTYEIAGVIKDSKFRFMVKNGIGRRYAFRPNLYGNIVEGPHGSIIRYSFRMDKAEKIILLLWTIPLLIISVYFIIRSLIIIQTGSLKTNDYYSFGIPVLMLVLTYSWFIISQLVIKDHKKLKHFIHEVFKDSIIDEST